jgi:intracellular multiplication protein IcmK
MGKDKNVNKTFKQKFIIFGVCLLIAGVSHSVFANGDDSSQDTSLNQDSQSTSNDNNNANANVSSDNSSDNVPINQKTLSSLQAQIASNPGLANKLADMLKTNQNTQVPSSNDDNQNNNLTTNTTTNTAMTNANSTSTNPAIVTTPFVPWQPKTEDEAKIRDQAFQNVANQAFPLSPDQIQTLNNMLDATKRAQAQAPNDRPPMPTSSSLIVNLSPGATPPIIRLSNGFVSSLVFIDSTGAPWPIEAYDLGNPSAFNIQWNKKSNTLMVQALSSYTYGNLAVKLEGMNTPVMLTLVPGQQQVDYRVDLRIQGMGPQAAPALAGSGLPDQANKTLLDILDGISPQNSKKLQVSGGIAEAWQVDKILYVRTRFTLLSPAWVSKMSSADGMNAYELRITPLILVSRYGKVLELKIEGM